MPVGKLESGIFLASEGEGERKEESKESHKFAHLGKGRQKHGGRDGDI